MKGEYTTGIMSYAEFAQAIANHLISIQGHEGRWLASEPFHVGLDQTTEISIWLAIISDELSNRDRYDGGKRPIATSYSTG